MDESLKVFFAFLTVCFATYLTYRFAKKNSEAAHNTAIKVDRLRRDIEALERLWELLAYMSIGESKYAIVRWRENSEKTKEYFFHFENLKRFVLEEVSDTFYQHHAGLFLPKKIRNQLFEYRGSLIGLYLKYENDDTLTDEAWIKLENPKLITKLTNAYTDLNKDLKDELELRYQQLLISPNSENG